ncbi:MAG: hypothetical protein JSV42_12705 [Chloroflexota bacterium]|nr:MAG: hypothetical protein JSV42_12705 [Chloroflexota bacterium]
MNNKKYAQPIIIFVALLITGLLMVLSPYLTQLEQPATEVMLQNTLPLIGSALMTAGLVFFLQEMTRLARE